MEEAGIPKARWELDQNSFEALLTAIDPDRSRAGLEYERLRRRLVLYFTLYQTGSAEDLADEAFNRLARKIHEGESIREIPVYLLGIARMLRHEEQRRLIRQKRLTREMAVRGSPPEAEPPLLDAIEACLEGLPQASVALITRYYGAESRARIETRKQMAREMGISLNALRNRALRSRQEIEDCAKKRLALIKSPDTWARIISKGER